MLNDIPDDADRLPTEPILIVMHDGRIEAVDPTGFDACRECDREVNRRLSMAA